MKLQFKLQFIPIAHGGIENMVNVRLAQNQIIRLALTIKNPKPFSSLPFFTILITPKSKEMKKPTYPNRKSIRLQGYDYASEGWYFVTVNSVEWKHIFGEIKNGKMHPSKLGEIIEEEWKATAEIRKYIKLHAYVVMPNHFHAIVEICYSVNKENIPGEFTAPKHTLSAIMRSFKGAVTRKYKSLKLGNEKTVWHGRFHDHIIRNERSYLSHTKYIENNVKVWAEKRGCS